MGRSLRGASGAGGRVRHDYDIRGPTAYSLTKLHRLGVANAYLASVAGLSYFLNVVELLGDAGQYTIGCIELRDVLDSTQ